MRRLLLALLVLLALASLALWMASQVRLTLAQRALDELLRRAAIPGAMARISSVELDGLRIRNLAAGTEPIFQAAELVIEMPWRQLREFRAASVTIRDAELRIHWDDDGLSFGSLDPWLESAAAASASNPAPRPEPPPIPVDRITLEHVTLAVGGDFAPLRLGADGELRMVAVDRIEADLQLVADRDGSLLAGRLEAVAIHSEGGWQARGEFVVPETQIDSAWLSLAPGVQDVLLGIRGRAAARIEFALESGGVVAGVDLALAGIDLRTPWGRIAGISGTLRVDGPEPLSTPPGQLLAIRQIDVGLPLLDGLIEFQLTPEGVIDVRRATWHWAGGTLRAAGAWQPDATTNEATLHVEGLQLGTLLELTQLEGLTGSGLLDGFIPVFQDGERFRIEGGRLAATGPGRIRLVPDAALGAVARQGGDLAVVFDALEDFRFEELSIDLDGDTRGELHLRVHLKGNNPNFQAGRPVEFNLNLDAHLADLVRAGITAYDLPEVVQKRLESFQSTQEDSE